MRLVTIIISSSHAPECISLLNWTLRYEWHAIVVLSATLPNAVPVKCNFHALHVILNVDDDSVILADLNARPRNHSISRQYSALNAIGEHALAMTPHGIRSVWCAHLAGAVNG